MSFIKRLFTKKRTNELESQVESNEVSSLLLSLNPPDEPMYLATRGEYNAGPSYKIEKSAKKLMRDFESEKRGRIVNKCFEYAKAEKRRTIYEKDIRRAYSEIYGLKLLD